MNSLMDLDEAQRRVEKALRLGGYIIHPNAEWVDRGGFYSFILSVPLGLNALLWKEGNDWWTSISLKVGNQGDFILAGGKVERKKDQSWSLKPYEGISVRINEVKSMILRWDRENFFSHRGHETIMRLAIDCLRNNQQMKAKSILLGGVRGELYAASISEALSIVQHKWFKSRAERLRSSLIFSQVFQ